MKINEFTAQLRAMAAELKPLAMSGNSDSLTWDGSKYVKAGEAKSPDPYALAWQSQLNAIAELIEAQESPLTSRQIAYLNRLLFGGMGSFQDLFFDSRSLGSVADDTNRRLEEKRNALFVIWNETQGDKR